MEEEKIYFKPYVKKYCEQKGIKLVEIKYNDNITKILNNEFRR